MPKTLSLFDMSAFLHAGHINKHSCLERIIQQGATWASQRTPTGGTSLIFNTLYEIMGTSDIVMVCDRNPTIKKEMYPYYKYNRAHKPAIQVERGAAEYILQECGATVIARAGYEADDIIYSLVKDLHDVYDTINIYAGDSDYHFLVDEKVSILPSNSRGKTVTIQNYEQVAGKGGCKYNLSTMQKILQGDSSDCIPALPKDVQKDIISKIYWPAMYPKLGVYENVKYLFDDNWPQYSYQVDLVFPLYVPGLPQTFSVPDRKMICNFGNAIRNSNFVGRQSPDFDIEPHIDALHSKGIYLEVEDD